MRQRASRTRLTAVIAGLLLAGGCAGQDGATGLAYDDPAYPIENTALVRPAPGNSGKLVITAAGGQPVQCGGPMARTPCQRVRLLPGTTVVRFDYMDTIDGRPMTARGMDLPVQAQGGHVYHLAATVTRDASVPSGMRVTVEALDQGLAK